MKLFLQRTTQFAVTSALGLSALEVTLLLARMPGARQVHIAAAVFVATLGACGVIALPLAALLARWPIASGRGRALAILLGAAAIGMALYADATAYVRLYGRYHALLGLVVVFGAVLLGSVWAEWRALAGWRSVQVMAVAAALGPWAMNARHDTRACAANRGVLLADVFWATRRDVDALPPLPRAPSREVPPASLSSPRARPQLVLLLTVDALRADALGSAALRTFRTLRTNAVRFTEARALSAWTVPSIYALMTARGPWSSRFTRTVFVGDSAMEYRGPSRDPRHVWPLPIDDTAPTLAEAMRARGYRTAVCATLPFQVPHAGLVRGFDRVDLGVYRTRNYNLRGTTSDLLTACGLSMIAEAPATPLFLWLHYSDPHEPYAAHDETPAADDSPVARYAAEVAFVDLHVGGLLRGLARQLPLDRTLIVLTADHGEEFGEHGGRYHAVTLYEEIVRVPLLIAAPGFGPRDVHSPVSLVDVTPTVLELVDARPLPGAEGGSLVAAMLGGATTPRPVFAESLRYGRGVRSVVDGRYKLIFEARALTYELYDLAADPGEQRIITDERPDEATRLARMLGVPEP